jgi:hypothetical protein
MTVYLSRGAPLSICQHGVSRVCFRAKKQHYPNSARVRLIMVVCLESREGRVVLEIVALPSVRLYGINLHIFSQNQKSADTLFPNRAMSLFGQLPKSCSMTRLVPKSCTS